MYLHCLSLVLHLPLKQRPCGQPGRRISSFFPFEWIEISIFLPDPSHRCIHPSCAHLVDTAKSKNVTVIYFYYGPAETDVVVYYWEACRPVTHGASLQLSHTNWRQKSVWGGQEGGRKLELTWLESPVQFSGMSQSFTASLHTTPINSICKSAQWKTDWRVHTACSPYAAAGMLNAVYLAIDAAEAVATLGTLGQRALLTAGPAFSCTLLQNRQTLGWGSGG